MRLPGIEASRSFGQFFASKKEARLVKKGEKEAERIRNENARQALMQKAADLTAKMQRIEIFDGTKEAYQELRGGELFSYVRLSGPNQYVRGSDVRQAVVMDLDYGSPWIFTGGSIFEQAAAVDADAVVNAYAIANIVLRGTEGRIVYRGTPIKRVETPVPQAES